MGKEQEGHYLPWFLPPPFVKGEHFFPTLIFKGGLGLFLGFKGGLMFWGGVSILVHLPKGGLNFPKFVFRHSGENLNFQTSFFILTLYQSLSRK